MSKHRPSTSDVRPRKPSKQADSTTGQWESRVFRNSFTREGRSHRLKGWSFKVQLHGRRRTFSLTGRTRAEAALEARQIHRTILNNGWEAALNIYTSRKRLVTVPRFSSAGAKRELAYWEQRLIQRPYNEARLAGGPEFSVRIDHAGAHCYFPLGSHDRQTAVAKAREIHHVVVTKGWAAAFERFEREITFAIAWFDNPFSVTYTTLFTFLREPPVSVPRLALGDKFLKMLTVLEPDATAHACIRHWLDRQPGFFCHAVCRSEEEMLQALNNSRTAMVLLNHSTPGAVQIARLVRTRWPDMPVYPYRIHEDSDQIFTSVSGISGGYVFRRRLPMALFDPLQPIAKARVLTALEAGRCVRNYFQSFFGDSAHGAVPALAPMTLTNREQQILNLIGRGCPDKEIAHLLDISIWTVHNHLKNIYEKLGVHNRTEAVLKCLQR